MKSCSPDQYGLRGAISPAPFTVGATGALVLLPPLPGSFVSFGLGISFGGVLPPGAGITGAAPAGRGAAQPPRWEPPHGSQHGPCDFFAPHFDFSVSNRFGRSATLLWHE